MMSNTVTCSSRQSLRIDRLSLQAHADATMPVPGVIAVKKAPAENGASVAAASPQMAGKPSVMCQFRGSWMAGCALQDPSYPCQHAELCSSCACLSALQAAAKPRADCAGSSLRESLAYA